MRRPTNGGSDVQTGHAARHCLPDRGHLVRAAGLAYLPGRRVRGGIARWPRASTSPVILRGAKRSRRTPPIEVRDPATSRRMTVRTEVRDPATSRRMTVGVETRDPATARRMTVRAEVKDPATARGMTVRAEVRDPATSRRMTGADVTRPARHPSMAARPGAQAALRLICRPRPWAGSAP